MIIRHCFAIVACNKDEFHCCFQTLIRLPFGLLC